MYGCLSWACSGTTRRMRNRPFDAVLLRRDGGNWEVPPGGWASQEDHERVLRAVIRAVWPDREPTWPAFLEGGGGAPHHGCGCQQMAPPGFAQRPHPVALPPAEPATAAAPAPTKATTQVTAAPRPPRRWARGAGEGTVPREAPTRGAGPRDPHPPTVRRGGGARATSSGGGDGGNECEGRPTAPQPTNR